MNVAYRLKKFWFAIQVVRVKKPDRRYSPAAPRYSSRLYVRLNGICGINGDRIHNFFLSLRSF